MWYDTDGVSITSIDKYFMNFQRFYKDYKGIKRSNASTNLHDLVYHYDDIMKVVSTFPQTRGVLHKSEYEKLDEKNGFYLKNDILTRLMTGNTKGYPFTQLAQ